MNTEMNTAEKNSQCECIKASILELTGYLNSQKELRNSYFKEKNIKNNEALSNALTAIKQLDNEILELESKSRTLGCTVDEKIVASYDSQSILSSSLVTKKIPKLLIEIPKGYFDKYGKK